MPTLDLDYSNRHVTHLYFFVFLSLILLLMLLFWAFHRGSVFLFSRWRNTKTQRLVIAVCDSTWNEPSACWHAPCYGCLFLQGSQVILANPKNLPKCYCGALSLAQILTWHFASLCASNSFPARQQTRVTVPWAGQFSNNTQEIGVFSTRMPKAPGAGVGCWESGRASWWHLQWLDFTQLWWQNRAGISAGVL